MGTPLVSVLMTAYNREKYIEEAISSVLNSSYKNFELIIVDDCSSDNTLSIAQKFEEIDIRVKVYRNNKNIGDYANRNVAISYANGEYLKFLDSDDIIYPHGLEVMVNTMEKFPEAAIGISQNLAQDSKPYPITLSPHQIYEEQFFIRNILLYGPTACIYRTGLFKEMGGFNETRHNGDILTVLNITKRYSLVKITSGLIWWRKHDDQEFAKRKHQLIQYDILKQAIESNECPLTKDQRIKAINKLSQNYSRQLFSFALRKKQPKLAIQLFKESKLPFIYLFKGLLPYK